MTRRVTSVLIANSSRIIQPATPPWVDPAALALAVKRVLGLAVLTEGTALLLLRGIGDDGGLSLDGARDLAQALRAQSHEFANKMHVVSGLLELGRHDDVVAFISRESPASVPQQVRAPGIDDPELEALLLQKGHLGSERGIRVVVDPTSTHTFEGNSDVLTVVANLVDNALEALFSDGTIEVAVHRHDDAGSSGVRIVVSDDGPGLGELDAARIFDVGVSSKERGLGRSRGIGLALVQRITGRRRGKATAGEREGGGTRVEVFLRAVSVPATVPRSVSPGAGWRRPDAAEEGRG